MAPCRTLRGSARQKRPHLAGLGVVRVRQELLNQRDEVIFSYESAFLVARRPEN
jgi:hypothetical protein